MFLRKAVVRAEIEKLHSICCYLRQVAQLSNRQCILSFDTLNGSYTYENTHELLPKYVHFGAAPDLLGPPSDPHKKINHGVTFPLNQIIFYPTGIVHAGTVYLSDIDNTCTYALTCAVSQASYLRKYYYNSRWELVS